MKYKVFFIFLMGILFIPNFVLAVNQNTHSIDFESSSSQYAFITDEDQTGLDLSGDCSFEAWVKLETIPNRAILLGKGTWNDNKRSYYLQIETTGKVAISISSDGSSINRLSYYTAENTIETGTWYHIAVSLDISEAINDKIKFYVNGENVPVDSISGSNNITSIYNSNKDFLIGAEAETSKKINYLNGLLDDVRIWNDVRTAQEIADNYQKELVGDETGLVGYWKFNNNALDTTSNDNDLTIANSPSYSSDYAFKYDPNPDPDPTPTTTPTIATEDAHIMNTILLFLGFVLTLDLLRRIFMPLDKKRGL